MGAVPVTVELLVTSVAVRDRDVIALDVLDGVGVVGVGWICVGNSDGLVVFDGVVEGELNGVSVDGNSSDGVG